MVFVTDPGSPVAVEGLQSTGSHDMGPQGKALMYGGNDLKEGHAATVTLTPSAAPAKKQQADASGAAPAAGDAAGGGAGAVAKAVAGVGGGVGLLLGAGYVLLKPPAKSQAA